MPKKPPPNAFLYFMKDVQRRMKENGQRVPSLAEMPKIASPEWNRLTAEEKAPYEQRVKAFKRNRTQTEDGKFTSDGIPIQLLQKEEDDMIEKERVINSAVRSLITTIHTTEEIAQTSFFIMGFNILIGTYEKLYLPNEIGIVEYSIQDGIRSTYHEFIDPGPIPVGYTSAAKEFSETVHKIPISGFVKATNNYSRIYSQIKRFLDISSQTETRFIFCHPDQMDQFQRCLDWLCIESRVKGGEEMIFGDLAILLEEMRSRVDHSFGYGSMALDAITTSAFDYSPGTCCEYHDELDNKNCALGYCRRLAYVLSDNLCKFYGVEITKKHFPERQEVVEVLQWRPKGPLRPVVNQVDVAIKPLVPHIPTTIVKNVRSKFVEEHYSVTPSAMSETSSIVSESPSFLGDDDDMFPSLSGHMGNLSLSSAPQQVNVGGASWAQVSSKTQPLRKPRTLPNEMNPQGNVGADSAQPILRKPKDMNSQARSVFNVAPGIGRGRGLLLHKNP